MRWTLPALLTVLVVVSTVAAGTPAPTALDANTSSEPAVSVPAADSSAQPQQRSQPVVSLQNTSGYLALPGATEQSTSQTTTVDVMGAVAVENGQLQERFLETATIEAFENADTEPEQTTTIEQAADAIETRTAVLERQRSQAIEQYNRDSISTATFLRELAVIDARARTLERSIDALLGRTGRTVGYSLPNSLRTRLQSLKAGPNQLQGPIQDRLGRSLSGAGSDVTVYIKTSENGVVLARLDDDTYIREAFVGDEYQPDGGNQFSQGETAAITEAYNRARALYPWAFENRITSSSLSGFGDVAVYRITVDHAHGNLYSLIDGASANVFREVQEKRLSQLPIRDASANNTAQLTMRANQTHESGPMQITVTDTDTGDPVDARLSINERPVGQTGDDGSLWTIRPDGPLTINATTSGDRNISLELSG